MGAHMRDTDPLNAPAGAMLCIASYEKGHAFLMAAAEAGAAVVLLTAEKHRDAAWPRASLQEVHTMANDATPEEVLRIAAVAGAASAHRSRGGAGRV